MISTVSVVLITYHLVIKGENIPLLAYAGPFTTWIVFFMLGVYLSGRNREYPLRWPILVVVAGFMLECIETHFLMGFHNSGAGIKLSSFIFSFAAIALLLSKKLEQGYAENNGVIRTIRYCGQISFGIYLAHCYVIGIVSRIAPQMSWGTEWLTAAVITVCAVACCKRLFPSISEKFLGIR